MAGCGGREEGKIHCCLEVKANKRHGGDQELSLKIQHTGFVTFPLAETRAISERLTLGLLVGKVWWGRRELVTLRKRRERWNADSLATSETMVPLTLRQVKPQLSLSSNAFRHVQRHVRQMI